MTYIHFAGWELESDGGTGVDAWYGCSKKTNVMHACGLRLMSMLNGIFATKACTVCYEFTWCWKGGDRMVWSCCYGPRYTDHDGVRGGLEMEGSYEGLYWNS